MRKKKLRQGERVFLLSGCELWPRGIDTRYAGYRHADTTQRRGLGAAYKCYHATNWTFQLKGEETAEASTRVKNTRQPTKSLSC